MAIIDPFDAPSGTGIVDPFEAQAQPASSFGQTALDVAKQVPAGIAQGVEAIPGAIPSLIGMVGHGVEAGVRALGMETPEVAEKIRQREALGQQIQSGLPTLEKSGLLPAPETTAGQYARTASEFIPAALSGPGGVTRRVLTGAVAPGVASEAAGQATAGTEYEPYARAAATFMPFGRIRPGEVHPSFDAETLFDSGSQKYKAVDALDTQWKPQAIANLGDRIDASMSRFNRVTNGAVYSVVDRMRGIGDEAAQKAEQFEGAKPFVAASDIDAMRRQLRDVDHSQSAASYHATKMLDDYMANTKQADLLQGNAQQASQLLKAARDDWAAAYRTQIAQGKIALGHFNADTSNSGMNVDNSIRQAIKQLVRPNAMGEVAAKKLGYNDDEIAGLAQIAKGTKPRNLLRMVGNMMPGSGGGMMTGLGMATAAGSAYYTGDPNYLWGAALAPIGMLLRKGANRITDQEAAKVADLISRRSSLGRSTPPTMIPSQAAPLAGAAALRAGTALGTEGRKSGGAVKGLATKAQANYRGGTSRHHCAICTMFVKPSSCTSVRGHISPRALCDFYEPKGKGERIVDNKHDVVTGANSSKKPTGPIYIDRHIPEWSPKLRTKDGKRVRLWTYLSLHEDDEQKRMEKGETYDTAHEGATLAEKNKAEADGVNWKAYTAEVDGYLDRIEHEKVTRKPPVPLHVKPEIALKGGGHHHSSHKKPRRAGGGGVDDEFEPPTGTPNPFSGVTRHPVLQMGVGPGFVGSSAPGAAPLEGQVIAPSSPNVAKAITRANAWMQDRAQREPQPALQRNIEIMMRGGPMAEAVAKHTLSTFQPHPSEALPSPSRVIDMGDE